MLTLVPKVDNASDMKNFRPISQINCSFKVFGKLITSRLERTCQRIISKEQSAFLRGRFILESVVVAHEVLHSVHKNKEPEVIIKLDYEKAYDRVNLDFLLEILRARGFGERMIGSIKNLVFGGSVNVLANGEESATFKAGKGIRQGDPLSPLLFNLVVDALTKMLSKAAGKGLVKGLLEQFRPGGILDLQYADDTLLFSSCDPKYLRNLKCVLMLFERVSGMKINFHKSELISMNFEEEYIHNAAHILSCPLPVKYLGIPLYFDRLKREDVQPLLDKLIKRMTGWRGSLLAYSSRLTLVKIYLASIPIYLLSFLKFPK
jgi:hypothetical protein